MAFGLMMAFIMPPPMLEVVIPNMYGVVATPENPAPLTGWTFHQFHGVMLGLGYVAYAEHPSVAAWIDPRTMKGGVTHSIIWGIVTAIVFAVFIMPLWLQAVGFPEAPSFPNIGPGTPLGLLGHIIYAVLLGVIYALYRVRT